MVVSEIGLAPVQLAAKLDRFYNTYRNTYEGAAMRKKLTITLDERVYDGLHTVIGRRRINCAQMPKNCARFCQVIFRKSTRRR